MGEIFETNDNFDFTRLHLLNPTVIPGGNFFIKFRINERPLYIQPPKCKTKQGIVKAGKRFYCDLMFTNEHEYFIRWMENLESYCRKIIFDNREKWFETDLDEHDIENSFTSPLKLYKSGKFYISRTNVPSIMGNCSLKIYDEGENEISYENMKENNDVMTVLEIQGIRCSLRNFQIDIEVKQMMIMNENNIFEKCVFKKEGSHSTTVHTPSPSLSSSTSTASHTVNTARNNVYITEDPNNRMLSIENIQKTLAVPKMDLDNLKRANNDLVMEGISNLDATEVCQHAHDNDDADDNDNNKENDNGLEEIDDIGMMIDTSGSNKEEDMTNMREVDFDLEKLPKEDKMTLKQRNDIYYNMYRDAKRKAKLARDLAISSYLEAKHIKNTYMLDTSDMSDSESDLDEDDFENMENNE
jgi:hypothetical protein